MGAAIALCVIFTLTPMTWGQFIKQKHSLSGPFESTTMEDWFLSGNAAINTNFIRLTQDERYNKGGIWNIHTCQSPDWELQINFYINGKGHSYGDGIGIWYVKDPLSIGPVFGSKNYFSGLGVFIDTSENLKKPHKHRHPYISAMVNNGSLDYYHDEDGTAFEIGNCQAAIRNMDHITQIAISYIEDTLTIYLDAEGLGHWKACFKAMGVHLPTGYHFGISASTSDVTDIHDLIAITALEFNVPRSDSDERSNIIPNAEIFQAPKDLPIKPDKVQEVKTEKVKEEVKEEKMKEEKAKQEKPEVKKVKTVEVEKDKEAKKPKAEAEKDAKVERKRKEKVVEKETKENVVKEKIEPPYARTSSFTKFIYVIGSLIIIAVAVSTCQKYFARRKESMQKRLY